MSGQTTWCAALLDPDLDVPPGLVTWNGSDPVQRFAIYRNNVTVSLMEALADTFPATQAVAGEGRFRDLARAFVRTHPPSSPVLTRYGRGFPVFMADSDLASLFPYLPDLARLELACLDALHAADAQPIDPDSLASALARPETLPSLRLALHPSLAILCSPYAVVSLWAAHQEDGTAPAVDPLAPESAWVLRRGRSLRVLPMSAGDCRFVGALQDGATLGDAAETAACPDPGADSGFDLTRCLAVLLREQVLTGIAFTTPT